MPRIRPEGGLSGTYQTPTAYAASGMWTMRDLDRNRRIGSWPADAGAADEFFKYNGLLTHFNGTANDNNNIIKDYLNNTDLTKIPFADTYSANFPGTLGYRTPLTGNFTLTSDFTMEMYVYFSGSPTNVALFNNYAGQNLSVNFALEIDASNKVALFINGLSSVRITGTTTVTTGVWYHVAVVRSSGVIKLYINGVQEGSSYSFSGTVGADAEEYFIAQYNSTDRLNGYLSNLRVTNTAVYTSAFAPPTTTLTAISGTQLLIANSPTFVDNSSNAYTLTVSGNGTLNINPFVLTRTGNPGQGTFSPYSRPSGNWSNYFNGSAYHTLPAFNIGTGDFTVECWFNSSVVSAAEYPVFKFVGTSQFLEIRINASKVQGRVNDGATVVGGNTTITAGAWYHVALVRSSGVDKLYINGIVESTTAVDTTNYSFSSGRIGANQTPNVYYTGFISNFRVVIGTALYTNNFTAPGPLSAVSGTNLLTCQNNSFKDNSANNTTLTPTSVQVSPLSPFAPTTEYSASVNGGSYSFNGSDYARIGTSQTALGLSTGNWTIEFWVFFNSIASGVVFDGRTTGGGANQTKPTIFISSSGVLSYYVSGASRITTTVVTGQWYHVAVVKNTGVTRMYINGIQTATSYTDAIDYGTSMHFNIGATNDTVGSTPLTGYVTDIRITKSAVYTSSFTPPTAPLTDSTSPILLLRATDGKIIDQTGSVNISTVSGAKISTTQSKFGGSSVVLNGSSDYLMLTYVNNTAANPSAITLGAGDFTIEGWVYTSGSASTQTLFQINGNSSGYASARLDITTGNALQLLVSTSGAAWAINYTTPSAIIVNATWQHVALVRSGSNFYIFVDGVQRGVTQTNSSALMAGSGYNLIGAVISTSLQNYFNGYIDEFRISKYARYTSNFTPSSIPFSNR